VGLCYGHAPMIDFTLSDEQSLIVETVRDFVRRELMPHDDEIDRLGYVPDDLLAEVRRKSIEAGLYAMNMPVELGGGGLDYVTRSFCTEEFARAGAGLASVVHQPTQILLACEGEQREQYLLPTIRGDRMECFALTEPGAGSDARAIQTRAVRDGDDWILNGTKQFISHADHADFIIAFAVTGQDDTPRGPRSRITSFLVDKDLQGVDVQPVEVVSCRGYNPHIITFSDVRVPDANTLGREGHGFDFANDWLYSGRVMLGAMCLGRAKYILELSADWAATRKAFGHVIGDYQGISFKLADMQMLIRATELLVLNGAWKLDQGTLTAEEASIINLHASEMVGTVADHGVQIFGGMGLSKEFPMERLWRDARAERIWEGTSEIHRHVIGRSLVRAHTRSR
jgi:acyl-CoA dehydrogenase